MSRATSGGDDLQDVRKTELPFVVIQEQVEWFLSHQTVSLREHKVSLNVRYTLKLSPRTPSRMLILGLLNSQRFSHDLRQEVFLFFLFFFFLFS